MIRNLVASGRTAALLGIFLLGVHGWWFVFSQQQSDVLSGLGGCLAALGIWVATQPYIRKGLIQTAHEEAGLHHPGERHEKARSKKDEAEEEGIRHVVQERIVGVILIAVGSLFNGYGPAIAHVLALRGS